MLHLLCDVVDDLFGNFKLNSLRRRDDLHSVSIVIVCFCRETFIT